MATLSLPPQAGPAIVWDAHPDFVLAAKPAGMSFHSDAGTPGFVARIKALPGCADLHVVHRLDRITSGLILCARNAGTAAEMGRMFEAGAVEKYYLALSDHKPAHKQGTVSGAMVRARGGNWRLAREGGLWAVTRFFSRSAIPGLRLFVIRPASGRTHQIRVALKSLGAPILGDARYGGSAADRGYLHACALCLDWHGESWRFMMPPAEGSRFTDATPVVPEAPWTLDWPV